jgi:hypothetical protein
MKSDTAQTKTIGLLSDELTVLDLLVAAWHAYLKLPDNESDLQDVRAAVHAIQRIVAYRVAKRVNPDYWR